MSRYRRLADKLRKHSSSSHNPQKQHNGDTSLQLSPVAVPSLSISKAYDPWIEGEQILRKNPRTKGILENARKILRSNGLDLDSSQAQNHQRLCSFLDDRARKLDDSKWKIGDSKTPLQAQFTTVFKNILMVKDLVNTAASSSPPAAIACASLTVVFTVSHLLLD